MRASANASPDNAFARIMYQQTSAEENSHEIVMEKVMQLGNVHSSEGLQRLLKADTRFEADEFIDSMSGGG